MKQVARFFLILFIAFLSTPTIIRWIEKSNDTTILFSISEEEPAKKEVKNIIYIAAVDAIFELKSATMGSLILSKNLSKHDNISRKIFSPPPNLV